MSQNMEKKRGGDIEVDRWRQQYFYEYFFLFQNFIVFMNTKVKIKHITKTYIKVQWWTMAAYFYTKLLFFY